MTLHAWYTILSPERYIHPFWRNIIHWLIDQLIHSLIHPHQLTYSHVTDSQITHSLSHSICLPVRLSVCCKSQSPSPGGRLRFATDRQSDRTDQSINLIDDTFTAPDIGAGNVRILFLACRVPPLLMQVHVSWVPGLKHDRYLAKLHWSTKSTKHIIASIIYICCI